MPRDDLNIVPITVSDRLLLHFYDKDSIAWNNDYPIVKNPQALMDGLEKICKSACGGEMPERVVIYVLEEKLNPEKDPDNVQYVILVDDLTNRSPTHEKAFSISLIYQPTRQRESFSWIGEDQVIWSADNMSNTQHENRTKFYLGFTYMICEQSPGFEKELTPEYELTGADLLEMGFEGEIPPEIIEVTLDTDTNTESATVSVEVEETDEYEIDENDYASLFNTDEEESDILSGTGSVSIENANTDAIEDDEEIDDLMVDFEELFD